ncbi:MAG: PepSY domain-containing protein [Pyrinomonadaceae bacterium]
MKKLFLFISLTFILAGISTVSAQQQKKIGMKKAKALAMGQVQGQFKSSELEKEHGKLVYSFDIKTTDGKIKEVQIDAYSGAVVAVEEESAEKEAMEKQQEKAEKAKKKTN